MPNSWMLNVSSRAFAAQAGDAVTGDKNRKKRKINLPDEKTRRGIFRNSHNVCWMQHTAVESMATGRDPKESPTKPAAIIPPNSAR